MPGICLAIFARDLLLAQLAKQSCQRLPHAIRPALEGSRLNRVVQPLQLIVGYANCNLL